MRLLSLLFSKALLTLVVAISATLPNVGCSENDCAASGTCAAPIGSSDSGTSPVPNNDAAAADASTDANSPIQGEPLDPKTLALTGWWRASYSGTSWPPAESAGTSAANAALTSTDAPLIGSPQNGLAPALFNGTSNSFVVASPGSYFTPNAWSFLALVKVTKAQPLAGSAVNDCGLFHDNTGALGVVVGTNAGAPTIRAYTFGPPIITLDFTGPSWAFGVYTLVQVKFDGKDLRARVNGDPWKSLPTTAAPPFGTALVFGEAYNLQAPFLDGSVLEMMTADKALSDSIFDGIRIYASMRYKLTL